MSARGSARNQTKFSNWDRKRAFFAELRDDQSRAPIPRAISIPKPQTQDVKMDSPKMTITSGFKIYPPYHCKACNKVHDNHPILPTLRCEVCGNIHESASDVGLAIEIMESPSSDTFISISGESTGISAEAGWPFFCPNDAKYYVPFRI
jgi:hypothetical protein